MSTNAKLSDRQWFKIRAFLRAHPRVYVGNEANCRLFVEAVHWVMRTGAQWRFLPKEYGNWNSVYKRHGRWCDHDVWEEMHQYFADDVNVRPIMYRVVAPRMYQAVAATMYHPGGGKGVSLRLLFLLNYQDCRRRLDDKEKEKHRGRNSVVTAYASW